MNDTFFNVVHVLKNTTKQLKSKDPSGNLIPMPKSVSKRKIYSMHKILSLSLYPVYVPIYRLRGRSQPKLGILLQLNLRTLSKFDLDLDSLSDVGFGPNLQRLNLVPNF